MQRHSVAQKCAFVVIPTSVRLEAAVQRLMDVTHEMDDELQRVVLLRARGVQLGRVVQDGTVQTEVVGAIRRLHGDDKHSST
jgi:hypothetical protein